MLSSAAMHALTSPALPKRTRTAGNQVRPSRWPEPLDRCSSVAPTPTTHTITGSVEGVGAARRASAGLAAALCEGLGAALMP